MIKYTKEEFTPRDGCVYYSVELDESVLLSQARALLGTYIILENISYNIVGVETFAQPDDCWCSKYGLLVKEINKNMDNVMNDIIPPQKAFIYKTLK